MAPPRKSHKSNQGQGTGVGKESPDISLLIAEKIAATIPTIALLVSMRLNMNQMNPAMEEVQANHLTDDLTRSGGLVNPGQKREAETPTGWKTGGNANKRRKGTRNLRAMTQVVRQGRSKKYGGTYPKCARCNYHHHGNCPVCHNCNRVGHFAKYCRGLRKDCYAGRSPEHMKNIIPGTNHNGTLQYEGALQKCNTCDYYHKGNCPLYGRYPQPGLNNKNYEPSMKTRGVCHGCGGPNHHQNTRLEMGREAGGSGGNPNRPNYQGELGRLRPWAGIYDESG